MAFLTAVLIGVLCFFQSGHFSSSSTMMKATAVVLVVIICFIGTVTCENCGVSSMGYTCAMTLSESYTLHYTATTDSVKFAAEVKTTGWVGLGFSSEGGMVGSEAVIGFPTLGDVNTFSLEGKSVRGVQLEINAAVSDTSIETRDGVTTMRFTRALKGDDRDYTLELDGSENVMVFSYSPDGSDMLQYHGEGKRGVFSFMCEHVVEKTLVTDNVCEDGTAPVNCLVDPCEAAECPAYPSAVCVPDYCGGCTYNFWSRRNPDRKRRCHAPEGFFPQCRREMKRFCQGISRDDVTSVNACLTRNWGELRSACKRVLRENSDE